MLLSFEHIKVCVGGDMSAPEAAEARVEQTSLQGSGSTCPVKGVSDTERVRGGAAGHSRIAS